MKNLSDQQQHTVTQYMYLGLLPFLAGAIGPWIAPQYEPWLIDSFLFYSGLILVFLAGALWALALFTDLPTRPPVIHGAIGFSLWPLVSYFFSPFYAALWLIAGFLGLLFWEKCYVNSLYPAWYHKLRHKITFIVVACHMLTVWNVIHA